VLAAEQRRTDPVKLALFDDNRLGVVSI